MKEIADIGIADYINRFTPASIFGHELTICEITGHEDGEKKEFSPVRLNAYSIYLVLEGKITIEMDCQKFHLSAGTVMEMGVGCLLENILFSPGMKGYHIMIARDLMKEIINPLISLSPNNMLKLKHMYPSRTLDAKEVNTLQSIIGQIQNHIADKEHYYHRQLVKNTLSTLIMELNDSLWKRHNSESEEFNGHPTVKEQFRQLLVQHCKEHHEVSFYADKLCITPDHLSKVMRDYSGRSAIKWINHALVIEAKILLSTPNMTMQRIAEILHFSDQSTFGKFFKKQTGRSPMAYKKER